MHYTKTIYNKETLLGMLKYSIGAMIENDICYFCKYFHDKSKETCSSTDTCELNLFEGLLKKVREKEHKNGAQ